MLDSDRVLYAESLSELPVLGTLIVGTTLHIMSGSDHTRARTIYILSTLFAVISVVVPTLHRTYMQMKPDDRPIRPLFKTMASVAKQSLWLALLLFVMGVVMDNKSISPSEVAIYAVLALVHMRR